MCTKKELVEWLEANVPDDMEVRAFCSSAEWIALDLANTDQIEVTELPGGPVLFIGS